MRREKTLRQRLTPFFFLAVGIPIGIFACISQYRLHTSITDSLNRQTESSLSKANQSLDMVLDKYDTLLYDLCTDEEMLALLENVNQRTDELEASSSKIRNELIRMCNRNNGIAGITIQMEEGEPIYYDQLAGSSENSIWASEVQAPKVGQGAVYEGVAEPISMDGERIHTVRIARRFVDYRDIHKDIGTIVMSVETEILSQALKNGNETTVYLYEEGTVICSPDPDKIGKSRAEIETGEYLFACGKNEKSGFTICIRQSLDSYYDTLREQGIFWLLIAVATITAVIVLSYVLSRPYLKKIDDLAEAMNEVEMGNLQVTIAADDKMPMEIRKISAGFNEMVRHIEELIEQVKEAVVEQKNAELSALEAQIDPHFLYNTLDTINWKAIEKGQFELSEMVGALADILRYSVKNAGDETTIEQELYWLQQYIYLQSAKAGKELQVKLDIEEGIKGCRIHKLLLQPFVENAIRHGMRGKEGECRLLIAMRRAGDQIHIAVKDNGKGIDAATLIKLNDEKRETDVEYTKRHMGVMNVRRRLKLYYEDKAAIYFESEMGSYTKVHLFIPASNEL